MITAWSHSRLVVYEQCPFHLKLKYIDKIPEPIRPLPSGKKEHANERGTRIHEAAELFVKGGVELIPELGHFAEELHQLRDLYEKGTVSLEGDWGFNYDWEPVGWTSEDIWGRVKLDAFVQPDPEAAIIIDYKSGKKYGNEIKLVDGLNGMDFDYFLSQYPDEHTDFLYRYVQPLWRDGAEDASSLRRCLEWLRSHPNWSLSRQDHKHWTMP